jgi:glyoxylate reductase
MEKIFVTGKIPEKGIKLLEKNYKVEVFAEDRPITKEEIIENSKDADAVITLLRDKMDKEVIDNLKRCKIIANYAVGYNNIDVAYANSKGIKITNTPDILTETTAELAWALLFAVARKVVEADKFVREGRFKGWESELFLGTDIYGKVLGVIGSGRIATAFAEKAKAFKMKILYFSRHKNEKFESSTGAQFSSLENLLKESDFVSLHIPLNDESYHLITEKEFKIMKKSAFLINTARGAVIKEKDLVEALQNGEIAGAGLDVYEFEPKLVEGLKELNNVVITPHIGSASFETRNGMSELVAKNIINVLAGKEPLTEVKI